MYRQPRPGRLGDTRASAGGAAAPHPHDHAPGGDLLRPSSPVSSTAATGTPGAAGRPRPGGERSRPRRRQASVAVARLDHPGVRKVRADQGFAGRLVDWMAQALGRELEIVRKDPDQRGFQARSKRWAVERTFSWLTAHRRLARGYEASPARSKTMIQWAMIGLRVRRLTRMGPASRPGSRPLTRSSA
ncbi:transposase [Streptomyces sp. NPDC096311]|uniref:transposase n=1 Tax=Streptomyces sp. NPDC096311 TaxID=3366083 RepID=UPI003816BCE6